MAYTFNPFTGTFDNTGTGGSGSPGGSDTYVQYNDSSAFGGDSGFTYIKGTKAALIGGALTVGGNSNTLQMWIKNNASQSNDLLWIGNTPLAWFTSTGVLNLPLAGLKVGVNKLVVTSTGVGINTATPSYPLHLNGNVAGSYNMVCENQSLSAGAFAEFATGCNVASSGGVAYIHNYMFGSGWVTSGRFVQNSGLIDVDSAAPNGLGIAAGSTTGSIRFYTGGNNERARFDGSTGNFSIGTTSVGARLTVQGAGSTSGTNALNVTNSGTTSILFIRNDLRIGVLNTSPTALFHIGAGTATANTAPLKFTTGTSLTAAEAGAVEFTTDDLFFTITTGAARKSFILSDGTNLTSGTIPVATTNGRLINSGLTFSGSTLTVTGLIIGTTKITSYNGVATTGYGVPALVDTLSLTAQAADIADTNIANAGTAGLYRVSYYLLDSTADLTAGAVTLNIKYTDDAAARTQSSTPVALTATSSFTQGVLYVRLNSGTITYGVTHTGIFGTATYALYVSAERLN